MTDTDRVPLTWTEPPDTIDPYRVLLSAMITNDGPCGSPCCPTTMLGHLLDGLPRPLVDLVRAEDPDQPSFRSARPVTTTPTSPTP